VGEAAGGHSILNHKRDVIRITAKSIDAMDIRGYLKRDHQTGLKQIKPDLMDMMSEMEYGSPLMRELGPDCSGPMVAMCRCRDCRCKESETDQTLTPEMQHIANQEQSAEVVRIVRNIKARRR
jgi:hypothetical protein